MNVFTSLDIAANSLVASYMGRGDRLEAQRVLRRILSLGVFAGACMATLMVGGAEIAPAGFTTDRGVRAAASRVFPLLGVFLVRSSHQAILEAAQHIRLPCVPASLRSWIQSWCVCRACDTCTMTAIWACRGARVTS